MICVRLSEIVKLMGFYMVCFNDHLVVYFSIQFGFWIFQHLFDYSMFETFILLNWWQTGDIALSFKDTSEIVNCR